MDDCVRLLCFCVVLCVQVAALHLADPPSKESSTLWKKIKELKKAVKAQQRAVEP
jgi:hypothetical protein